MGSNPVGRTTIPVLSSLFNNIGVASQNGISAASQNLHCKFGHLGLLGVAGVAAHFTVGLMAGDRFDQLVR